MTTTVQHAYEFSELADTPEWTDAYWELGYLMIKNVFPQQEIDRLAERFEAWLAEGQTHPSTFRHQNKVIWIEQDPTIGKYVRGMQWPSYEDKVLDAIRTDSRMLQIVEPLIGRDLKQIINQLHWKLPGAFVTWGLHRDVRSRKPDEAFRELATSYVQVGLAIDQHSVESGAMKILPRSHTMGGEQLNNHSAERSDTGEAAWNEAGFDLTQLIDVKMDPGDVALWAPFTIHGGGVNTTENNARRLYINGYVIAENCDRGEVVFVDGEPQPLGEPALIQYDQLYDRPDPHYPHADDQQSKPSD